MERSGRKHSKNITVPTGNSSGDDLERSTAVRSHSTVSLDERPTSRTRRVVSILNNGITKNDRIAPTIRSFYTFTKLRNATEKFLPNASRSPRFIPLRTMTSIHCASNFHCTQREINVNLFSPTTTIIHEMNMKCFMRRSSFIHFIFKYFCHEYSHSSLIFYGQKITFL